MQRSILIPLDGSTLAERAIPYAAWLGRTAGDRLILQTVIPGGGPALARAAETGLEARAETLRNEGLAVETLVVSGEASQRIVEIAGKEAVRAIVMSTRGRSGPGRCLFGSVADRVLRRAEVPVLLVPAAAGVPWSGDHPLRILVPLDGSALAESVFPVVDDLAGCELREVLLLRVVERLNSRYGWALLGTELDQARAYLERAADALRTGGLTASTRVVVGAPSSTIAAVAREQGADLIAMATHGRSGLARLVMGSATTGTLQRSAVPVLVVRPPALRASVTASSAAVDRKSVPTAQVSLTLAELDLALRGLGELIYLPTQERPAVEAAWELLNRLKRVEAALSEPRLAEEAPRSPLPDGHAPEGRSGERRREAQIASVGGKDGSTAFPWAAG